MVTINCPLHPETEGMFNDALIGKMKRGAYLDQHRPRQDLRPRRDRAGRWKADSSPVMPATSGSRSRRRRIIPGARCRITA